MSGFLAAFAGALFVHQQNGLQLDSYSAGESLVVFTMVVIGGLGSVPGALLGALFVRGVTWWLPVEWQIVATGAGMLLVLLVFRGGLGAALADVRDAAVAPARTRGAASPCPRSPARSCAPPVDAPRGRDAATGRRAAPATVRSSRCARSPSSTTACPCSTASTSTRTRARSSRSSARTARGSRRCSTPIAGVHPRQRRSRHHRRRRRHPHARRAARRPRRRRGAGRPRRVPDAHGAREPAPRDAGGSATAPRSRTALSRRARALPAARRTRRPQRAGDLSGGEQHMLTLAMALVASPRLLLVDELSLGLSPEATAPRAGPAPGAARRRRRHRRGRAVDRPRGRARRPRRLPRRRARCATRGRPRGCSSAPTSCAATFLGRGRGGGRRARPDAGRRDRRGPPALELRDVARALRWRRRAHRRVAHRRARRDRRRDRTERRRQDHAVRRGVGIRARPTPARSRSAPIPARPRAT